jgi:hypothetical protein
VPTVRMVTPPDVRNPPPRLSHQPLLRAVIR